MPKLLSVLSVVGTVAMLWVGGHILLMGADHLGWHAPYGVVHHVEQWAHHAVRSVGYGLVGQHRMSAVVGSVVGAVVLAPVHLLSRVRRSGKAR